MDSDSPAPDPVGGAGTAPTWVSDVPEGICFVGFGRRVAGRLLDLGFTMVFGFVAGIVGTIIVGVLAALGHARADWLQVLGQSRLQDYLWSFGGGILYQVICQAVAGASLGKLILGMRVLREDLRPCDLKGAVIRELAFFVDSLVFGLPGYSSMSDSGRQQRLGDRWGSTVVVTTKSVPALSRRSGGLMAVGVLGGIAAASVCYVFSMVLKGF